MSGSIVCRVAKGRRLHLAMALVSSLKDWQLPKVTFFSLFFQNFSLFASQLDCAQRENADLHRQLAARRLEVKEILDARTSALTDLRAKVHELQDALADKQRECDETASRMASQSALIDVLERELNALKGDTAVLAASVADQNERFKRHQDRIQGGHTHHLRQCQLRVSRRTFQQNPTSKICSQTSHASSFLRASCSLCCTKGKKNQPKCLIQ